MSLVLAWRNVRKAGIRSINYQDYYYEQREKQLLYSIPREVSGNSNDVSERKD